MKHVHSTHQNKLSPWVKAMMTPSKEDLTTDPMTTMTMLIAQMVTLATAMMTMVDKTKEAEVPTSRTMTTEVVLQIASKEQTKS